METYQVTCPLCQHEHIVKKSAEGSYFNCLSCGAAMCAVNLKHTAPRMDVPEGQEEDDDPYVACYLEPVAGIESLVSVGLSAPDPRNQKPNIPDLPHFEDEWGSLDNLGSSHTDFNPYWGCQDPVFSANYCPVNGYQWDDEELAEKEELQPKLPQPSRFGFLRNLLPGYWGQG